MREIKERETEKKRAQFISTERELEDGVGKRDERGIKNEREGTVYLQNISR